MLRDADTTDLPEIIEILNEQILQTVYSFRTAPLDDQAATRWFSKHEKPQYPILVAELTSGFDLPSGKRIAGWASLSPWSDYEAYERTAEVSVWIRPDCQRQGLGRQLMQALIERARVLDYRVLLSRIEAENLGSLKLHQAFDFRTIGTMHQVGEKFGRLLDVVMLEKPLR